MAVCWCALVRGAGCLLGRWPCRACQLECESCLAWRGGSGVSELVSRAAERANEEDTESDADSQDLGGDSQAVDGDSQDVDEDVQKRAGAPQPKHRAQKRRVAKSAEAEAANARTRTRRIRSFDEQTQAGDGLRRHKHGMPGRGKQHERNQGSPPRKSRRDCLDEDEAAEAEILRSVRAGPAGRATEKPVEVEEEEEPDDDEDWCCDPCEEAQLDGREEDLMDPSKPRRRAKDKKCYYCNVTHKQRFPHLTRAEFTSEMKAHPEELQHWHEQIVDSLNKTGAKYQR